MQPTKLPDELFTDDEWLGADYAGRVALLVMRLHQQRQEAHEAWEAVSKAALERDLLVADLRNVREVNAQFVLDLEASGQRNTLLLRQLADALSKNETQELTKGQ